MVDYPVFDVCRLGIVYPLSRRSLSLLVWHLALFHLPGQHQDLLYRTRSLVRPSPLHLQRRHRANRRRLQYVDV